MAIVKVKFSPSMISGREGTVYYQVVHNRVGRRISTGLHLFHNEWDAVSASPKCTTANRQSHVCAVSEKIDKAVSMIKKIIDSLDKKGMPYTSDEVVAAFLSPDSNSVTFFSFMRSVAAQMAQMGRFRISETYNSALNSFIRFRNGEDLIPAAIDRDMMAEYEAYLKKEGVCRNTSSFYMRNLRSVYNRAVDKGLAEPGDPFRKVYTGVDKTVKRAVSLQTIKDIRQLQLSDNPSMDFARDMFLFSFFTRGMSFVDMSYLRKSDLRNGILSYRRKKTDQRITICWESLMEEIVEKYNSEYSPYLLPIIIPGKGDERKQYSNVAHRVNKKLKQIGGLLKLPTPLTFYCARHSWASIAKSKNVPMSVISEAMGHDSEHTTRIYLASLDTSEVDKANRLILNSF